MKRRTLGPILWLVVIAMSVVFVSGAIAKDKDKEYTGPRKRIAVLNFEVKAPGAKDQVGEGLTEMAITALTGTGHFIVVERTELDEVLKEQRLGQSGKVTGATAAQAGQPDHAASGKQGLENRYTFKVLPCTAVVSCVFSGRLV